MHNFKLGKLAPQHDPRVPHLSKHMKMMQPAPAVDWTPAVKSWPMLGNDRFSDCTAAAVFHMEQCFLANNGHDFMPTDAEALALYAATSGYPKVDEGAVELDVLRYWSTVGVPNGFGTDTIAFASLNPANLDELRLSIQWLGGCYLGVALPLTIQTQTDTWDIVPDAPENLTAPGSLGGHAVCAVAYDEYSFTVVTWGELVKVTPAFMQKYLDESYAIASRDFLANSGLAPNGLNYQGLLDDMAALHL